MLRYIRENRSYILFLIANILFIYTIYLYGLANNKKSTIEDLNHQIEILRAENDELELSNKALKKIEEDLNEDRKKHDINLVKDKFINNIEGLFEKEDIKIIEYRLANTERIEADDFLYYKKVLFLNFISPLINLNKVINIISNERLLIGNMVLDRISKDDFNIEITSDEFSLEAIAHSGIILNESEKDEEEDVKSIDLLDENFGTENNKEEFSKGEISNLKKTKDIIRPVENIEVKADIDKNVTLDSEILDNKLDEYIGLAKDLDEKYKSKNNGRAKQIINSDYFEENYLTFNENKELLNNFYFDEELDEWNIEIFQEIDLSDTPLILKENIGDYYLKVYSDKMALVNIYLKTSKETELDIQIRCKGEGSELYQFKLPNIKELLPIEIYKIELVKDYIDGGSSVKLSNLVYVEE